MATKYFTPEFRIDANYMLSYNHPKDDTLGGSTESFRSNEWQVEQISVGGDIHVNNVRGRILTMNGMFASTTPRNDASVSRGNWDLTGAYKYVSEAWGGYHWDVNHGLNLDAGIFVSYIGLFSYYNYDNWAYQPSFVSSNTPWFFNGLRAQWFPTKKLKIEPWFVNGWQSYARYNGKPGLGGQILWRPKPYLDFVWNNYGMGEDAAGYPGRSRIHADYSVQVKYYDRPGKFFDKAAFSLTGDLGCEYGGGPASGHYSSTGASPEKGSDSTYNGGVNCHNSRNGRPKQSFMGWMGYTGWWPDEQSGSLFDAAAAHQRRDGRDGHTVLYGKWGRPRSDARRHRHLRLHAEPVHHVPAGDRLSLFRCALLDRPRRHYASRRKQWIPDAVCLREWSGLRRWLCGIRRRSRCGCRGECLRNSRK
jgi:hypothetical protein